MSYSSDRVQSSQIPVRPLANTLAYYVVIMALGLTSASLGPTLLGLAENTHTEINQISILFVARSLGFMLGALIGGRALDRLPAHGVFVVALGAISITLFLAPLVSLVWVLALVLLLVGMSMGTLDMGSNTLITWVHRDRVGPYMQGLHLIWGVGAFLSPIVVVQLWQFSGSVRWSYWLLALLFVPAAVWLARLPSPRVAPTRDLTQVGTVNYRLVALVALFLFAYVGAETTFGGWIFTYATAMGNIDLAAAGYVTSVFWGAMTLGRVMAIPLATRLRPSLILLINLLGCLLSVSLILLLPSAGVALWAGTFGLGLFMASIFPTVLLWAGRRMTLLGSITRWFFVGASLGGMIFPWTVGQFFERSGPQITMLMVLALLLVALGIFWRLMHAGGSPREVAG